MAHWSDKFIALASVKSLCRFMIKVLQNSWNNLNMLTGKKQLFIQCKLAVSVCVYFKWDEMENNWIGENVPVLFVRVKREKLIFLKHFFARRVPKPETSCLNSKPHKSFQVKWCKTNHFLTVDIKPYATNEGQTVFVVWHVQWRTKGELFFIEINQCVYHWTDIYIQFSSLLNFGLGWGLLLCLD